MIAAVTELAYEQGARRATVSEIVRRAGISRRSFYEVFPNAEQCLLAALQDALARARLRVLAAQEGVRGGWRARTRVGLTALLAFFDDSPQAAYLLVVESLLACPEALLLRERVLCELVAAVRRAGADGGRGPRSPELVDEALVGAALAILHRRLLHDAQRRRGHAAPALVRRSRRDATGHAGAAGEPAPPVGRLIELTGPLMSMFVLPSLGAAAARRELEQPPISLRPPAGAPGALEDALCSLGVRCTSRTILVLSAIGQLGRDGPGPSNRQVALAAGVSDQGQASKLLARLRRHGLIESSSAHGRGLANAWRLTAKGEAVVRSLPEAA